MGSTFVKGRRQNWAEGRAEVSAVSAKASATPRGGGELFQIAGMTL